MNNTASETTMPKVRSGNDLYSNTLNSGHSYLLAIQITQSISQIRLQKPGITCSLNSLEGKMLKPALLPAVYTSLASLSTTAPAS
jgi:hypothetical protein